MNNNAMGYGIDSNHLSVPSKYMNTNGYRDHLSVGSPQGRGNNSNMFQGDSSPAQKAMSGGYPRRNISPISIRSTNSYESNDQRTYQNQNGTNNISRKSTREFHDFNHSPISNQSDNNYNMHSSDKKHESRMSVYNHIYTPSENLSLSHTRSNSTVSSSNYNNYSTQMKNEGVYSFNPYSNNSDDTHMKMHLTPYQIQKKKMKQCFTFPNGEKYTPKEEFIRRNSQMTVQENNFNGAAASSSKKTNSTNYNDAEKSTGLVSSIKKLFGKKKKIRQQEDIKKPEPLYFSSAVDETRDNHQRHFTNSHAYENGLPSQPSSHARNDLSAFNKSTANMDNNYHNKRIKFDANVEIRGTWSSSEYERKNELVAEEYDKFITGPSDNPIIYNSSPKKQSLMTKDIKIEVNRYKESEMYVHQESHQNTHYFLV